MSRKPPTFSLPLSEAVSSFLDFLFKEYNPRKIVFLTKKGGWQEDPRIRRDRVSHALLHELWRRGQKTALGFLESLLSRLAGGRSWALTQKIWSALDQENAEDVRPAACRGSGIAVDSPAFLALFEVLLWIIQFEAFRINADAVAPEWNRRATALKSEFQQKFCGLNAFLGAVLTEEEKQEFSQTIFLLKKASPPLVEELARLIAEEEKITATIERLLDEAASSEEKEAVNSLIIDLVQPAMGIVTQLTPALFFPCLRLLVDSRVEVSSGIPYAASVVLSIFGDPRSTKVLLEALERYSTPCTKIRENIIYTIGNLKEGQAVGAIARVLEEPDETKQTAGGKENPCLLLEQKEEAIWALGKIGLSSVRVISSLAKYADHPSARLKTYLAWTLGEVGRAQKESSGGVSADILIALLKLVKEKNKQVFEEAVSGLQKIRMPEFIHSLYLYHAGAISILGLKPAQRGLNELSETVHYLLQAKKRVVLAVNGDSGTGKTYFCQAIAGGFAGLRHQDILYLMRDTKRGQKVFNRLLGLDWLKKHIDPAYYQDYPLAESEDNPEAFFQQFLEESRDKRLIILDGCRDRHYFQRVIDVFYQHGELNVEVNFRANFSTRRLNLEEREFALESVRLHLAFLEEPALEDTSFYQEGVVILYDLDNSIGSRLNSRETKEIFDQRRIDSWGELIRVGELGREKWQLACRKQNLDLEESPFTVSEEKWPEARTFPFSFEEKIFRPLLNEDLKTEPSLLLTIPLSDLLPDHLRFYAQDQVAGSGRKGSVFVLTFLDYRIFQTMIEDKISELSLLGRNIFLTIPGRGFLCLSFERNEVIEFPDSSLAPLRIAASPPDRLITAHEDGLIRVWDFLEKRILTLASNVQPVRALAADPRGLIYAAAAQSLWQWDLDKKKLRRTGEFEGLTRLIRPYHQGKIVAVEEADNESSITSLKMIDFESKITRTIPTPLPSRISSLTVTSDGRIIAGLCSLRERKDGQSGTLVIFTPQEEACLVASLSGHGSETSDCLAMGPKIITSGLEADGSASIRVWGGEFFVRTELGKLRIKPH
jgi:HEAT repeat protein